MSSVPRPLARFEQSLRQEVGVGHALGVASGTAALHLALLALGVERGDTVFCQSLTFSASANPIMYQGATPVFIDSEPESWNMDPWLLNEALEDAAEAGNMPKAIIPVHFLGMPANLDALRGVSQKYQIPIVEDAAEAFGSRYKDAACGSLGDLSILSFSANKILSATGGGALLSDSEKYINTARYFASLARDPVPHYQHSKIGYNYKMPELLAGIALEQLPHLDRRVQARVANFERYKQFFHKQNLCGFHIRLQTGLEETFSNRWLTCIQVDPDRNNGLTREVIRRALGHVGIESRPLSMPMHRQPVFSNVPAYINRVSDRLFEQGLCLPSGSTLTESDFERIFSCLDHVFYHASKR